MADYTYFVLCFCFLYVLTRRDFSRCRFRRNIICFQSLCWASPPKTTAQNRKSSSFLFSPLGLLVSRKGFNSKTVVHVAKASRLYLFHEILADLVEIDRTIHCPQQLEESTLVVHRGYVGSPRIQKKLVESLK